MNRCACVLALLVAGCGTIGVRPTGHSVLFDSWHQSIPTETISSRTWQTLRAWDLDGVYQQEPIAALTRLQATAEQNPDPTLLFSLAEISYLVGQRTERRSPCDAIPFYYLCAGYAYHYLYSPAGATQAVRAVSTGLERFDPRASPFDPRFRLACDLYNAGLAKCIRAAQRAGQLDPRQDLQVPSKDGRSFTLTVAHLGFRWKPEEFGSLLLAEDYRSEGLTQQNRTYGLGVPLIATRKALDPDPDRGLYPRGVAFPVTAFFRFDGTLTDLRERRAGRLELHNPLSVQSIDVKGVNTPLETDLTTPLAYFLEHADLEKYGVKGFLRPDEMKTVSGVYLVEPYHPGKIPVLLVHGILSSPLTWAPLYNDLLGDPKLRERYQFWFYLYPTANPYIVTAADLRDSLAVLRKRLDPQRTDSALDNMVFIAHSMGGLVSRLLSVDSGTDFWHLISEEPLEKLEAHPATRKELQRVYFFECQPYVKRLVFLGTPHHGSKLSPSLPARVLRYFVHLPQTLRLIATDLTTANPGTMTSLKPKCVPTSLDLLAPGSPALELLAARPKPAGVHYHSVIGVAPATKYVKFERLLSGQRGVKGDGVVPYASAYLSDARSQLSVPAEHTQVHRHPLAVQEVRRILHEHLHEAETRSAAATPHP